MHIDSRHLENNTIIEGDICIIGAGVCGISLALQWINKPYKIILLEGGGFEYDQEIQALYDGKITGQNYYPMMSSRLHYFGGSSGHWGGLCSPFDEIDFKKRDWVPYSGWPITFNNLVPYYKKAQEILDLGPFEYKPEYWQNETTGATPIPFDEDVIWSKIWQRSSPTRFGTKYKDSITQAKNVFLYTYSNVVNLKMNDLHSTIVEAEAKNLEGKTHYVRATRFILACSALQNARLLLSSNKQVTQGIGNNNDLVGRYFMEHPEIKTGELWFINKYPLHLYSWSEKRVRAELSTTEKTQEKLKVLNGTVSLMPLPNAKETVPNVVSWSVNDPIKSKQKFHKANSRKSKTLFEKLVPTSSYYSFGMYSRTEQAPNPNSRITLSTEKDALGMPKTSLFWQMSPIDKRTIKILNELIGQHLGILGLGRVKIFEFLLDGDDSTMPDTTSGGWHHMGTTRMHNNPKYGVVDENCKVHGINNLYIAGSSCFPTAGASTPTLTIVAITLRLAEHLNKKLEEKLV